MIYEKRKRVGKIVELVSAIVSIFCIVIFIPSLIIDNYVFDLNIYSAKANVTNSQLIEYKSSTEKTIWFNQVSASFQNVNYIERKSFGTNKEKAIQSVNDTKIGSPLQIYFYADDCFVEKETNQVEIIKTCFEVTKVSFWHKSSEMESDETYIKNAKNIMMAISLTSIISIAVCGILFIVGYIMSNLDSNLTSS